MSDYACFESEIQNVSGGTISHVSLFSKNDVGNGESFTIPGSPEGYLCGKFPGIKGLRMIRKLHTLIDDGILRVVSSPSSPCGDAWESSSSAFLPV